MNIKDKILGKRISGIFNALNILLGLFCIIYYSINANRVNEFNKAVDFYLVLAIMCCGIYVFADYVIADIFNLIAVVFITLSIGKMIVNSINTFADALNGISMLDRITGGWRGGQLVILAARPAMGKTAVALHFAQAAG